MNHHHHPSLIRRPPINIPAAQVVPLDGERCMAMSRKFPVISKAIADAKTLTAGRIMALAPKLPVFVRRAPLDTCRS